MMLPIAKIMTRDVHHVSPELSIEDAAAELREHGIRCAPVLNDKGELVGAVSQDDLLAAMGGDTKLVRDVMQSTIPAVRSDATAMEAVRFMASRGHDWVLVVGPFGLIAGVITPSDIVRGLAAGLPFDQEEEVIFEANRQSA
jgi:CBS domain-containing protein